MADMLIIGIAGGSGSGKSTIARLIAEKFGDDVTVLRHDDYYKAQHDLTLEERAKQNYDCPEAFDTALMAEHIRALRAGQAIDCPIYDYMIHDRVTETRRIEPRPVLLIDGILVLAEFTAQRNTPRNNAGSNRRGQTGARSSACSGSFSACRR